MTRVVSGAGVFYFCVSVCVLFNRSVKFTRTSLRWLNHHRPHYADLIVICAKLAQICPPSHRMPVKITPVCGVFGLISPDFWWREEEEESAGRDVFFSSSRLSCLHPSRKEKYHFFGRIVVRWRVRELCQVLFGASKLCINIFVVN